MKPVCSRCSDSHRMDLGDREVPCTFCPRPCEDCRSLYQGVRLGAYCETTPCPCGCHPRKDALKIENLLPNVVVEFLPAPGVCSTCGGLGKVRSKRGSNILTHSFARVDALSRMLEPHELATAMGFSPKTLQRIRTAAERFGWEPASIALLPGLDACPHCWGSGREAAPARIA